MVMDQRRPMEGEKLPILIVLITRLLGEGIKATASKEEKEREGLVERWVDPPSTWCQPIENDFVGLPRPTPQIHSMPVLFVHVGAATQS